jgi:hypothetical protein
MLLKSKQYLENPDSDRFKDLVHTIRHFTAESLLAVEEAGIPNAATHVKGIILSGEASVGAMSEFKRVVAAAIPEFENQFLWSIDPKLVGAAGAAHRARQFVTENGIPRPWEPPASLHKEL